MTLPLRRACLLWLLCLFTPGCVSSYAPAAPVAPLLNEAGDVAIGARMRALGPKVGASAFIAAAPTESTRMFVSGSFVRERGDKYTDDLQRKLRERSDSEQIEAGAGYGYARRALQIEALAGAAYGRSRSNQCDWPYPMFTEYPDECPLWVDARSWFVRPFVQANAAASLGPWQGGGGVRIAATRYQLEKLFHEPSDRVLLVPTLEPFIVQRVGFDWGKLELTIHMPVVVRSPTVRHSIAVDGYSHPEERTRSDKFALWPGPRVMLGVVFNIDELWRDRER